MREGGRGGEGRGGEGRTIYMYINAISMYFSSYEGFG